MNVTTTSGERAVRRPLPKDMARILGDCRDLAIHRLLLAVGGAVVIEEAVAGAVVAVELVVLAVLLQFFLVLVDVGRVQARGR